MKIADKEELKAQEIFLRFLVDGKFSLYRRSILLFSLIVLFLYVGNEIAKTGELSALRLFLVLVIVIVGPIAINLFVLIPKLLFKGKYFLYLLLVNINIVCFYLLLMLFLGFWWRTVDFDPNIIPKHAMWSGALTYIPILEVLCAATAAVRFFQKLIKDNFRIVTLENSLIRAELDLLKTNISPHFLFNMLNNSEVLIQTNPNKARQVLIKLSEFLRYQLYDSNRESVLLRSEIHFLEHFLTLEQVRRDSFEFEIEETGTDLQMEVAPLLFIPFVENAVKHNIAIPGAFVKLSFILNEKGLIFTCTNPTSEEKRAEKGGFGIPNVKRRLELLYPEKFKLTIDERNGIFKTTLILSI